MSGAIELALLRARRFDLHVHSALLTEILLYIDISLTFESKNRNAPPTFSAPPFAGLVATAGGPLFPPFPYQDVLNNDSSTHSEYSEPTDSSEDEEDDSSEHEEVNNQAIEGRVDEEIPGVHFHYINVTSGDSKMSFEGVDLTAEAGASASISWQ